MTRDSGAELPAPEELTEAAHDPAGSVGRTVAQRAVGARSDVLMDVAGMGTAPAVAESITRVATHGPLPR